MSRSLIATGSSLSAYVAFVARLSWRSFYQPPGQHDALLLMPVINGISAQNFI